MPDVTVHREGDRFVVGASPDASYAVPEATWERYQFLAAELSGVEDAIIAALVPAEEPEEVKALRAAGLSDAEIALILERRNGAVVERALADEVAVAQSSVDTTLSPGQLSAFPEQFPSAAPCPRHKRGVHVPARYVLLEDGTVDGLCSCGHRLHNVACPHQKQRLRGRVIICDWCNKPLIGNTGIIEPKGPVEEGEQPGATSVDVDRWRAGR